MVWEHNPIYYSELDLEKYRVIKEKVHLDTSRKCTDGLCCFLEDEYVTGEDVIDDIVLIRTIISSSAQGVVKGIGIPEFSYSCVHLKFDYSIYGDILRLKTSCNKYGSEERPDVCNDFPSKNGFNFDCVNYFCLGITETNGFNFREFFLYAFNMQDFSDLSNFSVGKVITENREYYLIPVRQLVRPCCTETSLS